LNVVIKNVLLISTCLIYQFWK